MKRIRFVLSFLVLAGCGYRWEPESGRPTISVPYVVGDADGSLTGEIIRALSASNVCDVRQWDAKYRLQARIAGARGETIGYRRDRQEISGESKKNLIASERRKTITIDAALYETGSDKIAKGPFRIETYADFDYVDGDSIQDLVFIAPNGASQVVLPFSLGQLESVESAEEAAMRPLYVRIATKIVDAIFAEL